MKEKYKKFWMKDNLRNVASINSLYIGEWDMKDYFLKLKDRLECKNVLDFGCGYGRLFPIFMRCPMVYFGIDLNPTAINKARKTYPKYKNRFVEVDIDSMYPQADMVLAYTVFLHLDDDTLKSILSRLKKVCKYIVIAETLGREWRPEYVASYDLPLYNRDLDDYVEIMNECGFELYEKDYKPVPHYENKIEYEDRNCNINILVFKKV